MKSTVFTLNKCKYYSNSFSELNFWTNISIYKRKNLFSCYPIQVDFLNQKFVIFYSYYIPN